MTYLLYALSKILPDASWWAKRDKPAIGGCVWRTVAYGSSVGIRLHSIDERVVAGLNLNGYIIAFLPGIGTTWACAEWPAIACHAGQRRAGQADERGAVRRHRHAHLPRLQHPRRLRHGHRHDHGHRTAGRRSRLRDRPHRCRDSWRNARW